MVNTHCPNCGSGNTQAAQMVIASGTRNWQGVGLGVGMDGGVGYGMFGGTGQSRLAAMLDPGPCPSYLYPVLAIPVVPMLSFFAYAVIVEGSVVPFSAWLIALVVIWLLLGVPLYFLRTRHRRSIWSDRISRLDHAWICRKCGWMYET